MQSSNEYKAQGMETQNNAKLKIKGEDLHDLKIISACMQDAIFPATAMSYHADEKLFVILANRFMWEKEPIEHQESLMYHRVHSGLYFCHVEQIHHWNIDQLDATDPLNLLAIHSDHPQEIHLVFSNQKQIRLKIEKIKCYLKDLHEPWHTPQKPAHTF